jgi:hypothetical protein
MAAAIKTHAAQFVWSYLLGPILAFLPARWRVKCFGDRHIHWRTATIVSGILQFCFAPVLLLFWSASGVCLLERELGFDCGGGAMQTLSLFILTLNPVTWLLIYLIFEGFGRAFAAAMLGETPGTLVLLAPDWLYLFVKRKWSPAPPPLPDLVTQDDVRADWQLKIEASRPKRDWEAGRLLRYAGNFYRIESCAQAIGLRPCIYQLRRLPAGVASRSVILYSPEEPSTRPVLSPQHH